MNKKVIFAFLITIVLFSYPLTAQFSVSSTPNETTTTDSVKPKSRLTIGGYGEAVYKYNFYSDNVFRYSAASQYADSKGHGRVDLPHAVFMLSYDFGRGWSFNTEVEFEHGGVEAAVEVEDEEAGEFEKEIERGGEVALEQFWIQKSFLDSKINIRAGHIVVPVGATNNAHLPSEFFGLYRPEGDNTIIPCTWHETGIELWGRIKGWRYDVMLIPALNSNYFTAAGWVHNGSASPYEFKVANKIAVAARLDNYSVKGLHIGISGYAGNSFRNDLQDKELAAKYKSVKGTVLIGAIDFSYKVDGLILRGSGLYGHLSDAASISAHNKSQDNSTQSPYPHTLVASRAWSAGGEIGYDIFHHIKKINDNKFYIFVRYEFYDSFNSSFKQNDQMVNYPWTARHCITGGINYRPIPEITIKAEGGIRVLRSQYNSEPWVGMGVTWAGFFKHDFFKKTNNKSNKK